jgi:Rrf2 family protein
MKFTKEYQNTVNVLLEMMKLVKSGQTKVNISELAIKHKISKIFTQHSLRHLVQSGILKSSVGKSGGYSFAKDIEEITLLEIHKSLGEEMDLKIQGTEFDLTSKLEQSLKETSLSCLNNTK